MSGESEAKPQLKRLRIDLGALQDSLPSQEKLNQQLKMTKSVGDSFSGSNNDLQIVDAQLSNLDPITQKEIVTPWKNQLCGHLYEATSIISWVLTNRSRGKQIKCPYAGCAQNNMSVFDILPATGGAMDNAEAHQEDNLAPSDIGDDADSDCVIIKEIKGRRPATQQAQNQQPSAQVQPQQAPPLVPAAYLRQTPSAMQQQPINWELFLQELTKLLHQYNEFMQSRH
eukprot:TRINITY_DN9308_c0_g1_i2.p1 TRINITY_DN9308_c0_g1~~TRINITY_DN9308_c0_g1_i2.p1  ORF type:complete len:240 (-),score=37.98 TRINITY_DN9308_c0_g1_i2:110-790(-)